MEKQEILALLFEVEEKLVKDVRGEIAKIRFLLEEKKSLAEEKKNLQLEEHNFKIDSTGWKEITNHQGIIYLENPEKDVWEYVGGVPEELIGQQLFTTSAGIRETEKVGKRMPTDEEWTILAEKKEDIPNLVYAGSRSSNGAFRDLSSRAHFWSSSISGSYAWYRYLHSGYSTVSRRAYNQLSGLSVRCLKN